MDTNIIEIQSAEIIEAQNRAEVDIQITTAKRYPRDIQKAINTIATYAALDAETAQECFYVLRRGSAGGSNSTIEGLSVRMAEIIAGAWGNIRVQTRIIANDGKTITAQAICHDLETNVAVSLEVKRRITDKNGRTFSEDMQVVTGNAASAIAYRNAVLKVVPKALLKKVVEEVRRVALGQSLDMETSRQNLIQYFAKLGVSETMLFDYLQVNKREEIDKEMVFHLRGIANAIKEGDTTVQETFVKPAEEKKATEKAQEKAKEAKAMAEAAKAKAQAATTTTKPEPAKPVTQDNGKPNFANIAANIKSSAEIEPLPFD